MHYVIVLLMVLPFIQGGIACNDATYVNLISLIKNILKHDMGATESDHHYKIATFLETCGLSHNCRVPKVVDLIGAVTELISYFPENRLEALQKLSKCITDRMDQDIESPPGNRGYAVQAGGRSPGWNGPNTRIPRQVLPGPQVCYNHQCLGQCCGSYRGTNYENLGV